MSNTILVPEEWQRLDPATLTGTVMVIGGVDSGKSTFARYLYTRLCEQGRRAAFLDCDVGQSTLGLPTTMTVALPASGETAFPPTGERFSFFVGSISPRGHMLPVVVGAHKLQRQALTRGAEVVVVDTSGMVDRAVGGGALKLWKIELLEPSTLVAFARGAELEHILWPWRRHPRVRVVEFPVSRYVNSRSREQRIAYRQGRWRAYFDQARVVSFPLTRYVVFELGLMRPGQLLAFQDEEGFVLGLGVLQNYDSRERVLSVLTPLPDLEEVRSLRFGSWRLDPTSGREWR